MRNGFNTILQIVQGDYGMTWSFVLQDSSGNPLDLSNAALTFNCQLDSDYPVKFQNSMTVVTAASGIATYTVLPTDFVTPGTYNVQIIVNYNTGAEILTFDGIQVVATNELPLCAQ